MTPKFTLIYKGCRIHSWLAGLSQLTSLRYAVQPPQSVDSLSEGACAHICCSSIELDSTFALSLPCCHCVRIELDSTFALSLPCCLCVRTFQTNAPTTPSMTMVHTRVNRTIKPVVVEDDVSASETIMLLVEIEATCQEHQ